MQIATMGYVIVGYVPIRHDWDEGEDYFDLRLFGKSPSEVQSKVTETSARLPSIWNENHKVVRIVKVKIEEMQDE